MPVGEIISRFEKKGFYLKGLKLVNAKRATVEKHYEDLSSMPFFTGLLDYMTSVPVVAMIWEGKNVMVAGRKMVGGANPADSAPGTIRGDFAMEFGRYLELYGHHGLCRNVIHGSDSVERANKEIVIWFLEGAVNWQSSLHGWVYE